jgi:hypothetical protein
MGQVNAALEKAPDQVRKHLSTFGSAAIRYRYDWQGAVYATMAVLDLVRSLEYSYPFIFPPGQGLTETSIPDSVRELRDSANGTRYEGLWFRNGTSAGGFLALANTGNAALNVTVTLSGLANPSGARVALLPHSTALIDLRQLIGDDHALLGGVTVVHSGQKGALQVAGASKTSTPGTQRTCLLFPPQPQPVALRRASMAAQGSW